MWCWALGYALGIAVGSVALQSAMLRLFGHAAPCEAAALPAAGAGIAALAALRGTRILLVVDDALNQQVGTGLLQQAGLDVDVAGDGAVGATMVDRALDAGHPYDLVPMHLQMPVMDGVAASRALRSRTPQRHCPILAMAANAVQRDCERCAAAPMNDFVAKPIEPGQPWQALARGSSRALACRFNRRQPRAAAPDGRGGCRPPSQRLPA